MHVNRLTCVVTALFITSLVMSCGGESGSSATPEESQGTGFRLFPDTFFLPAYHESSYLTGSTSTGLSISALYVLDNDGEASLFDGERAVAMNETITVFGNAEMWMLPSKVRTTFFSADASDRRLLAQYTSSPYGLGVTAPCIETCALPPEAQPGDSGLVAAFMYDNGSSERISWGLADAGNGMAILTLSDAITDPGGAVQYMEEYRYVIDHGGNRRSITICMDNVSNGMAATFSGDMRY